MKVKVFPVGKHEEVMGSSVVSERANDSGFRRQADRNDNK